MVIKTIGKLYILTLSKANVSTDTQLAYIFTKVWSDFYLSRVAPALTPLSTNQYCNLYNQYCLSLYQPSHLTPSLPPA